MTRCQDQHVTTSILSVEVHVVINKIRKRVRWIWQDGVVEDPVEVDEGVRQEDEEVRPVEEVGEVKPLLLNVLVNLGESRSLLGVRGSSAVVHLCILYMTTGV